MNTNTAIGVVVAVVVVLIGGYYLMNGSNVVNAPTTGTQNEVPSGEEAGKVNGSFADLATRSGSWKCTVDTSTTQAVSSGVTYVSDGKVRADFTTTVEGYGNADSHVLVDGTDVYTWTSMMPQGFKTKVTAQATGGTATSGQGVDANMSYAYNCEPWTADASLFVPPTNITFRAL